MKLNKEILINNESLLMDIQATFTASYPFLKIEFLATDKTAKTLKSKLLDPRTSIKQLKNAGTAFYLDFNKRRTVSEISHEVENALGVIVQVYRKSGNIWNVISITEGWTLESQNAAGEFISSEIALQAVKA